MRNEPPCAKLMLTTYDSVGLLLLVLIERSRFRVLRTQTTTRLSSRSSPRRRPSEDRKLSIVRPTKSSAFSNNAPWALIASREAQKFYTSCNLDTLSLIAGGVCTLGKDTCAKSAHIQGKRGTAVHSKPDYAASRPPKEDRRSNRLLIAYATNCAFPCPK